jgi:hypothetical protein
MDRLAKQQTCQLFIEQEIEKGLAEGKSTYAIGKELAQEIKRIFLATVRPETIEERARRTRIATNVATDSTPQNDEENVGNQIIKPGRGGLRKGAGRPHKQQAEHEEIKGPEIIETEGVIEETITVKKLKEFWQMAQGWERKIFIDWLRSQHDL